MGYRFRHSICNEVYQGWDFDKAAKHIRETGYDGIEIAPFTLAEDPATIPPDARAEYRRIIAEEGLVFAGLQWLMVSPRACTSPRPTRISAPFLDPHRPPGRLCADLGPNGIMVFGSPCSAAHRRFHREEATRRFTDGLASVAPHASSAVSASSSSLPFSPDRCRAVSRRSGIHRPANRQPGHPDDVRFS